MRIVYFFIFFALIFCININARATDKEYILEDLLFNEEINGEKHSGIKLDVLDHFLANISKHAGFYPPSFDNSNQRAEVEKKLRDLIEILKIIYTPGKGGTHCKDPELLLRYGKALSMGHNLDFPESDKEAIKIFESALILYPNDLMLNYHYGVFLSDTFLLNQKSIPYLKKAIKLGMKSAKMRLAMVYISNEQTIKEGEKTLIEYIQDFLRIL